LIPEQNALKTIRKKIFPQTGRGTILLLVLVLGWLWFVLINHLRVEWTLNPQYGYGWAVPFLCLYLIWHRIQRAEGGGRKAENKEESGKPEFNIEHPTPINREQASNIQHPEDGERRAEGGEQKSGIRPLASGLCPPSSVLGLLFLALLYAPTRLIQEANPEWRLVSWALAIEVVGLTLLLLRMAEFRGQIGEIGNRISAFSFPRPVKSLVCYFTGQRFSFSDFVFPICFFLVAVPWPTVIEGPLIQGLTRADAGATCELLGWLGIPAIQHGNVIEVATGEVGIDEACSGIRSFQATLMISLFLGELYRLNVARRLGLVFGGFAMSFVFNLARMSILVWVAARKGVAAIATWHDSTGVTILLACFFGLWALAVWLGKKLKVESRKQKLESSNQKLKAEILKSENGLPASSPSTLNFSASAGSSGASAPKRSEGGQLSTVRKLALALASWILLTEISVEAWYRSHEARLPVTTQWTVVWPTNNPLVAELSLPERTRQILRYDEGRDASWTDADGARWQAIFLRWNPGSTAAFLANNHTPEVCVTAAGRKLISSSELKWFDVNGLKMPFRAYTFGDEGGTLRVFYCLWNDRANGQTFATASLDYQRRLKSVLSGQRNSGQRSIELAVSGVDDSAAAENRARVELKKIVAVKKW
jgi:exosortase